ncbi:MAG: cytochrome c [Pseudomonadota bacterium]|nr:cytochrome c [Pseudomonadota bacterium]
MRQRLRDTLRIAACLACLAPAANAGTTGTVKHGEIVFRAAGCAGCHTDADNDGAFVAGGHALKSPFGTFYSPNITPDPEYGIGNWSEEDLARALTDGVSPNGENYYPAFPYTAYTKMRRADIAALKAYLDTIPPVAQSNRSHDLPWYLSYRPLVMAWNWLNFTPGEYSDNPEHDALWNRGAYIAEALSHCNECHTPRDDTGGLDRELENAGTRAGPDGETVPNITSDRDTGIGKWSEDDIAYYLETGMRPDGDYAGSLMAEVIDEGLSHLDRNDLAALARYVRSIPPIQNQVRKRKKSKRGEFD